MILNWRVLYSLFVAGSYGVKINSKQSLRVLLFSLAYLFSLSKWFIRETKNGNQLIETQFVFWKKNSLFRLDFGGVDSYKNTVTLKRKWGF